jgi:uncharacterized protein YyaL (SSP411 family)
MTNNLANENSPYLLQHAENPVDWYPWNEEALVKARQEDKPIFLSIGYAACHWCHVMAHESFEDPETAALMNKYFVNIKVDREERPDLDSIYMNAVVAMTGQGGWPLNVFLTPNGEPFFGGTYFPPNRRYNLPSFREVLLSVYDVWVKDRQRINNISQQLIAHLQGSIVSSASEQALRSDSSEVAALGLAQSYDWKFGGWARQNSQAMAISSCPPGNTWRQTALRSLPTRCWLWLKAACMTWLVEDSPAIAPITSGACRILRRCSMIMPFFPRSICMPIYSATTKNSDRHAKKRLIS